MKKIAINKNWVLIKRKRTNLSKPTVVAMSYIECRDGHGAGLARSGPGPGPGPFYFLWIQTRIRTLRVQNFPTQTQRI